MKLTKSGFKLLSVICSNFTAVFLGSIILPVIVGNIESYRLPMLIFGVAGTGGFTFLALLFAQRGKL